jgi:hypothetical protein
MENFRRADALKYRRDLVVRRFGQDELAAGQVEAGETGGIAG